MIRSLILAAVMFSAGNTFAEAKDAALAADAADCITTGAALALGLSEVNPISPIAVCVLKGMLTEAALHEPEPARTQALHAQAAVYGGAAVNNVLAIMGAGSAAPVFGLMFAIGLYASGKEEREFARLCAVHERLAGHPMKCRYTPSISTTHRTKDGGHEQ